MNRPLNNEIIKEYKEKNKNMLKDPLKKNFLDIPEYNNLFEEVILSDFDEDKVRKLEEAFKNYYELIRKRTYISNMLRQAAIDFDKKNRKEKSRFPLTLDQPVGDDDSTTFKDTLFNNASYMGDDLFFESSLNDEIADKNLFEILKTLSKKQYQILELCILNNKSNTEVAQMLNTTPQNISNIKRKVLQKISKILNESR